MNPLDQANASFALINLSVLSAHGEHLVKSGAFGDQISDAWDSAKEMGGSALDATKDFGQRQMDRWGPGGGGFRGMEDAIGGFGESQGLNVGAIGAGLAGMAGGAGLAKATEDEDEQHGTRRMLLAAIAAGVPAAALGAWAGNEYGGDVGQWAGQNRNINHAAQGIQSVGNSIGDAYGNSGIGPALGKLQGGGQKLYEMLQRGGSNAISGIRDMFDGGEEAGGGGGGYPPIGGGYPPIGG